MLAKLADVLLLPVRIHKWLNSTRPEKAGKTNTWDCSFCRSLPSARCASPVTVSDDLGSDFFCCLFETRKLGGNELVLPLNSFAIQIKSTPKAFDVTGKIKYLSELEVPFFVGVVERSTLALSVYSGEYLPLLFSEKGQPHRLRVKCVNQHVTSRRYYEEFGNRKVRVFFPRIAKIRADSSNMNVKREVKKLHKVCSLIHGNIATRRSGEHVYAIRGRRRSYVMAGSGSAKTFRDNFYKRLAEALYNFCWLRQKRQRNFDGAELEIYLKFVGHLTQQGVKLPRLVKKMYRAAKRLSR